MNSWYDCVANVQTKIRFYIHSRYINANQFIAQITTLVTYNTENLL